jgi:hypothetical protein
VDFIPDPLVNVVEKCVDQINKKRDINSLFDLSRQDVDDDTGRDNNDYPVSNSFNQ